LAVKHPKVAGNSPKSRHFFQAQRALLRVRSETSTTFAVEALCIVSGQKVWSIRVDVAWLMGFGALRSGKSAVVHSE
jgi:exosome complex RNA-binding protein Rrp42 (RNase PH superfamily)